MMNILRVITKLSSNQPTIWQPKRNYGIYDVKNVGEAVVLFNQILQTERRLKTPSYNHLLGFISDKGYYSEAIVLFKKLSFSGWPVNEGTRGSVVNCYYNLKEAELGVACLAMFQKRGYAPNAVSIALLIKGFFLEAHVAKALELCKKLITPGLFKAHEFLIITYRVHKMCETLSIQDAVKLLDLLLEENYKDIVFVRCKVINRVCENWTLDDAMNLLREMIGRGVLPKVVICNTFIYCYCKKGLMENAENVMQIMIESGVHPNFATYTSLKDGYYLQGQPDKAKEVSNLMAEIGMVANNMNRPSMRNVQGEATQRKITIHQPEFPLWLLENLCHS